MYTSDKWQDYEYELIDAREGKRLERWGEYLLIRPDPQIIWRPEQKSGLWEKANAEYLRSHSGGGYWEKRSSLPDEWRISYRSLGLEFKVKPMGFKHTGIFPEQAANWEWMSKLIRGANRPIKLLNMFAYTGGATLAAAKAGASVTHVDASKGMVSAARENASLSGLSNSPIRWIVDDCKKFAEREIRRGGRYDAVIMDPPSYGRGPSGEVWKFEECIFELICMCERLLSDTPLFFLVNSYTAGLSPSSVGYILSLALSKRRPGRAECGEIGIPVSFSGLTLPCGSVARFIFDNDNN